MINPAIITVLKYVGKGVIKVAPYAASYATQRLVFKMNQKDANAQQKEENVEKEG